MPPTPKPKPPAVLYVVLDPCNVLLSYRKEPKHYPGFPHYPVIRYAPVPPKPRKRAKKGRR